MSTDWTQHMDVDFWSPEFQKQIQDENLRRQQMYFEQEKQKAENLQRQFFDQPLRNSTSFNNSIYSKGKTMTDSHKKYFSNKLAKYANATINIADETNVNDIFSIFGDNESKLNGVSVSFYHGVIKNYYNFTNMFIIQANRSGECTLLPPFNKDIQSNTYSSLNIPVIANNFQRYKNKFVIEIIKIYNSEKERDINFNWYLEKFDSLKKNDKRNVLQYKVFDLIKNKFAIATYFVIDSLEYKYSNPSEDLFSSVYYSSVLDEMYYVINDTNVVDKFKIESIKSLYENYEKLYNVRPGFLNNEILNDVKFKNQLNEAIFDFRQKYATDVLFTFDFYNSFPNVLRSKKKEEHENFESINKSNKKFTNVNITLIDNKNRFHALYANLFNKPINIIGSKIIDYNSSDMLHVEYFIDNKLENEVLIMFSDFDDINSLISELNKNGFYLTESECRTDEINKLIKKIQDFEASEKAHQENILKLKLETEYLKKKAQEDEIKFNYEKREYEFREKQREREYTSYERQKDREHTSYERQKDRNSDFWKRGFEIIKNILIFATSIFTVVKIFA